jgi:hypothetical protein
LKEFSLENIAENIHFGRTKMYFTEVLSSYHNCNYKFVMTSTPKVIKFIIPILAWGLRALPEDYNSNSGSWSSDDKAVDAGKTYQNGVDGAQRVPGKTFYR